MQVEKDLIEVAMRAAGEVGAKGWLYVVEWTLTNAILGIVGYALLLVFFGWAVKRLLAWHPNDDEWEFPLLTMSRVTGLGILVILTIPCTLANAVNSVRDAIAPEGAAIMKALGRND